MSYFVQLLFWYIIDYIINIYIMVVQIKLITCININLYNLYLNSPQIETFDRKLCPQGFSNDIGRGPASPQLPAASSCLELVDQVRIQDQLVQVTVRKIRLDQIRLTQDIKNPSLDDAGLYLWAHGPGVPTTRKLSIFRDLAGKNMFFSTPPRWQNFFLSHDRATFKIYFCRLQIRLDQNMTIMLLKVSLGQNTAINTPNPNQVRLAL